MCVLVLTTVPISFATISNSLYVLVRLNISFDVIVDFGLDDCNCSSIGGEYATDLLTVCWDNFVLWKQFLA